MKKLVITGWVSFVMVLPESLFKDKDLEDPEEMEKLNYILMHYLNKHDAFVRALVDTEIYTIYTFKPLLETKSMWLSGDNGNLDFLIEDFEDFEILHF